MAKTGARGLITRRSQWARHPTKGCSLLDAAAPRPLPSSIMGDFNDEPCDPSVVEDLQASSELDRVIGPTNTIKKFVAEAATYRNDDTWLYKRGLEVPGPENLGTFFLESTA